MDFYLYTPTYCEEKEKYPRIVFKYGHGTIWFHKQQQHDLREIFKQIDDDRKERKPNEFIEQT